MMNGELLSCGYALFNIKVKDQLQFNKAMLNYYDNDNLVDTLKYLSQYYLEQIDI